MSGSNTTPGTMHSAIHPRASAKSPCSMGGVDVEVGRTESESKETILQVVKERKHHNEGEKHGDIEQCVRKR